MAAESGKSTAALDPALETVGVARFRHHDVGFRGLEFDDDLKTGKRSFNVNSITRKLAKYEAADQNVNKVSSSANYKSSAVSKKRYDLLTGKPKYGYDGSFS